MSESNENLNSLFVDCFWFCKCSFCKFGIAFSPSTVWMRLNPKYLEEKFKIWDLFGRGQNARWLCMTYKFVNCGKSFKFLILCMSFHCRYKCVNFFRADRLSTVLRRLLCKYKTDKRLSVEMSSYVSSKFIKYHYDDSVSFEISIYY